MENQNFEEPQVRVKHEPPVEFVLILPRPTIGWPAIKQEDVKSKRWVKSVDVTKFDAKWHCESKQYQTFFVCPHCQLVVKTHGGYLTQHLVKCSKINPATFECDICGERFQQKSQIRQHMLKHSNEKKFSCTKCGSGFKSKGELLKHSRSKRINKCAVCDVIFSCKLLLDRHQSEFHGNMYKCDKCPYQARNKTNLINHKGSHYKSIACETCQKKFSRNHRLKVHQMQHKHGIYATAPEETFDCDKCDKSYSNPNYLSTHKKSVHDKNEVKCEVCDKICKNRSALSNHSQNHAKIECSICHKTISKHFMSLHMQSHSATNIFECDLCKYSFKAKGNLKEHIERKHLLRKLVEDSKFREDFSDFEMLEKLQLRHGSAATTNERKFNCDKCSKAFVTPKDLIRHKKQVHADKLLECEICKKKVRQYQLKSHMKFHSPGNHFECDLCDYKSKSKEHLKKHLKGRHRDGALICPEGCREKFADFYQLIEHRKIHVGKKQWKCMKCEYRTFQRQNLFNHMIAVKHDMSL